MGVSKGHNGNKVENVFLINLLQSGSKLKKKFVKTIEKYYFVSKGDFFYRSIDFSIYVKGKW